MSGRSDPWPWGPDGHGPLGHLRVVELPGLLPVPFAAMMLADLGARVVRICRPEHARGDLEPPEDVPMMRGRAEVVVLNLKQEADRERLLELTDAADALLEGFRPGVAERLGIGPQVCCGRNPRLIYTRLTGWGQDGPLAPRAGHDLTYLALSGALGTCGPARGPPQVPGIPVADLAGGAMLAVIGVLAALADRERSGSGRVVDAAMVDGSALLASVVEGLRVGGVATAPRGQNLLDGGSPFYATYACADGEYLAVAPWSRRSTPVLSPGWAWTPRTCPSQYDIAGWPRAAQPVRRGDRGRAPGALGGRVRGHRRLCDAGAQPARGGSAPARPSSRGLHRGGRTRAAGAGAPVQPHWAASALLSARDVSGRGFRDASGAPMTNNVPGGQPSPDERCGRSCALPADPGLAGRRGQRRACDAAGR